MDSLNRKRYENIRNAIKSKKIVLYELSTA